MIALRRLIAVTTLCCGFSASAFASDLSYTFLDFQYVLNTVETSGTQTEPGINQTVTVNTSEGNGIAVAGSVRIGNRFYVGGFFHSSIIDVDAIIENLIIGSQTAEDEFDYIRTNINFGYIWEIGDNLDLTAELTYDTAEFDFGSFAGENFDSSNAGAGAKIGARWNPTRRLELSAFVHESPVGIANLSELTFESDTLVGVGVRWYVLEELGLSVDYETGEFDTITVSMRFKLRQSHLVAHRDTIKLSDGVESV